MKTTGTGPTPEELLDDRATPFWASDTIRRALNADPIDAANVLEVVAVAFARRADSILEAGERL